MDRMAGPETQDVGYIQFIKRLTESNRTRREKLTMPIRTGLLGNSE